LKPKEPGNERIDLKGFEKKIRLRNLRPSDFDAVIELQARCFPGMKPWSREQYDSHMATFPEGQFCVLYGKRIIASATSLIVDSADYSEWHNWREITDNGTIRNHDPDGDTLYGIEIMVDPEFRGQRLARRLYAARKNLARERNLARIIIGGRIPGYGKHAEKLTAREYVDRVVDKTYFDPVLTPQLANQFVLKQLIPDYLPGDLESRGYATYLEWINLDFSSDPKRRFHRRQMVRVAVVQYMMRRISVMKDFERQVEFFVDVASDYHADFILFPELFTLQLLSFVKAHRPGLAARRMAEYTPQYLKLLTKLAIKYNVNIIGGTHFTLENDALYNVSYLFRRDGTIGKQYKLHITPNERKWWGVSAGDRLEVFDTDRGKIAILICYDVEFPELCRIAADKGAQFFFVPYNTDERRGYLRVKYCAQARAIENHVFVAISGCVGNLPQVENADIHYAQSGIFTPSDVSFSRDAIGAECTPNIETIAMHDLDPDLLRRQKMRGTVQNWNDRRLDLYTLRYKEDGKFREI